MLMNMQPNNTYYGSTGSVPMSSMPRKNNRRRILLIVGGVFIVVLTIILGVLSSTNNGGNQAQRFLSTIAEGDVEGSYKMLSSDARQTTNDVLWKSYVEQNKDKFSEKATLAYEQKLDETEAIEYGYNIGETGKVTRVTIVVLNKSSDDSTGRIYSVRSNPTNL
jgi:hypothetical protein